MPKIISISEEVKRNRDGGNALCCRHYSGSTIAAMADRMHYKKMARATWLSINDGRHIAIRVFGLPYY